MSMTEKEFSLLLKSIAENRCGESLDLSGRCINNRQAVFLAEALKQNSCLRKLRLSSNRIGNLGVKALANALKKMKALRELQLNNNLFGKKGLCWLAEALEENASLEVLNLNCMLLGDEAIELLGSSLQKNRTLYALHLSMNNISARAAWSLLAFAPILNQVEFDFNPIDSRDKKALTEEVMRRYREDHPGDAGNVVNAGNGGNGGNAANQVIVNNVVAANLDEGIAGNVNEEDEEIQEETLERQIMRFVNDLKKENRALSKLAVYEKDCKKETEIELRKFEKHLARLQVENQQLKEELKGRKESKTVQEFVVLNSSKTTTRSEAGKGSEVRTEREGASRKEHSGTIQPLLLSASPTKVVVKEALRP